jgi:hypothetical protein
VRGDGCDDGGRGDQPRHGPDPWRHLHPGGPDRSCDEFDTVTQYGHDPDAGVHESRMRFTEEADTR